MVNKPQNWDSTFINLKYVYKTKICLQKSKWNVFYPIEQNYIIYNILIKPT